MQDKTPMVSIIVVAYNQESFIAHALDGILLQEVNFKYEIIVADDSSGDDTVSIVTVPMNVEWLDVGSWPSYGETLDADEFGNKSDGTSVHLDSTNVLSISSDSSHTIATIGCKDLVVVHTDDVTLVFPASEAQRVKEMHLLLDSTLK